MNARRLTIRYPESEKQHLDRLTRQVIDGLDGRAFNAVRELRELEHKPSTSDLMRVELKTIKWEGCL
jgi:hypothetical protein